jgi:hypothetical protein
MMTITQDRAAAAIKGSKGFITTIAKRLKCSRPTVYRLLEEYPELKQALTDERETQTDHVESKLFDQINQGNITAIIFYLKTQAKHRGYIERQELTGADGGPINLDINPILKKVWGNDNSND